MPLLIAVEDPSLLFKWVFNAPVLLYQLGLGGLVPKWMLILTTVGRKTGHPRKTAIVFTREPATGAYWVMSGWAGNPDWYRNCFPGFSLQPRECMTP